MTAEEAQELTGNSASAAILAALNRNHFFTERHFTAHPVYQYHPLFREFLLVRAEDTLPAGQMLELQRNAAALLERSGRTEPAAELMCKTGDWDTPCATDQYLCAGLHCAGADPDPGGVAEKLP